MRRSPLKSKIPLKRGTFKKKILEEVQSATKAKKTSGKGNFGRIKTSSRGKPKSIAKLKKELWVIFSKWVRQRDKYTCVTCGHKGEGSGIHAGHYITKAVGGLGLYFDEHNVHAQCYRCNIHLSGNWTAYREFMLKKYGPKIEQELMQASGKIVKWAEYDYEKKIAYYKEMLSTG